MPYNNLTCEQKEAVFFEGNLLLTACPGAGKTKTLVSKICYLIESNKGFSKKKKIVALTYTNVAADTISERISQFGIADNNLWIGTIHSFCLTWIIKPNVDRISRLHKGFSIINEYDKEEIIKGLKSEFNLRPNFTISTLLNFNYKQFYEPGSKEFKVVKSYHQYLNDNNMIDFDLILNLSCEFLKKYDCLCERLANLMSHILIDEYQDTSELQYEILRHILKKGKCELTLIGDKEQAIYTSMGSVVKNRDEVKHYFGLKDLEEKRLTGCFRSSQKIIDFYSKYKDEEYSIQSLSNLHDFNSVIHIDELIDKSQLPNYIINLIKTHLSKGIREEEIVILCPSWFSVIDLSKKLLDYNCGIEFDGVTVSPISRSEDNLWVDLVSLILIKREPKNYNLRQKIAHRFFDEFNLIESLDHVYSAKTLLKLINKISDNLNYDCKIDLWLFELAKDFCSQLNIDLYSNLKLKSEIDRLINATISKMSRFNLQYIAIDLLKIFNHNTGVKITTCHSTKGDEYDVVICTGLLNGKIPNWSDIYRDRRGERVYQDYLARRLLYVISSRAKKHLYMIAERGHLTNKGTPYDTTTPQL